MKNLITILFVLVLCGCQEHYSPLLPDNENKEVQWNCNLDTEMKIDLPPQNGKFIFYNNDSSIIEEHIYKNGELVNRTKK